MGLPTITQTWSFNPNFRVTFASLNDTAAQLIFQSKVFLVTTLGWTLKYTCDGTTGPTSSSDHTDRLASKTNCTTRFNGTGGAQSFFVATNADGVDVLFSYNGATDDILTVRYSPSGGYTPAATANQEPTATDEVIVTTGTSVINATASADRIFWFLGETGKRMFRIAVLRSSAIVSYFGVEKLTSALISPATWTLTGGGSAAFFGFFHNTANLATSGAPTCNNSGTQGSSAYLGACARVHTNADTTITVQGGGETYAFNAATAAFGTEKCELQGQTGELMFPLQKYSNTASNTGKVGSCIDWWYAITSSATATPALGDTYGTLQFVALGPSAIWPWDGSSTPVIA